MKQQSLTPRERRAVAVHAECCERSVLAFLNNRPMRSTTAARIAAALEKLRLNAAAPSTSSPAAPAAPAE